MSHTKEPWSINEWPQADREISIGAVGTPLIAKVMMRDVSINEHKANAERICACVNLLRPFTTEQIRNGIDLIELTNNIEGLATSLKDILQRFESCIEGGNGELPGDAPAIKVAKDLLKKVRAK